MFFCKITKVLYQAKLTEKVIIVITKVSKIDF